VGLVETKMTEKEVTSGGEQVGSHGFRVLERSSKTVIVLPNSDLMDLRMMTAYSCLNCWRG
jgi:hypothetical protein